MDDWQVAAIAAVPPTIAAIAAIITARRKLGSIHLEMNSRLDQLVKAAAAEADAVGEARGRAAERTDDTTTEGQP